MDDDVCEVIITAPDAAWLADFTRRLVDARLAASGHNITPIRSIYRWQGAIHDHTEDRVALHTRASLVPRTCNGFGTRRSFPAARARARQDRTTLSRMADDAWRGCETSDR
jgi:uncharacterized protein involved in tolerance to divalent cations